MSRKSNPNYLTPSEAAQTLDFHINYIYALLWAGKLNGEKHEGGWRIPATEIEKRKAIKRVRRNRG